MIDKESLNEKLKLLKNKTNKKVYLLSTLKKETIKSIKSHLLKYVS